MTAYRLDPSSGALVPVPEPAGLALPTVTPCTVDYCGEPAWSRRGRCRAHYAATLRRRAARQRRDAANRAARLRARRLPAAQETGARARIAELEAEAALLDQQADRIEAGR